MGSVVEWVERPAPTWCRGFQSRRLQSPRAAGGPFLALRALCVFARVAECAFVLCIACLYARRGSVSAQRV